MGTLLGSLIVSAHVASLNESPHHESFELHWAQRKRDPLTDLGCIKYNTRKILLKSEALEESSTHVL